MIWHCCSFLVLNDESGQNATVCKLLHYLIVAFIAEVVPRVVSVSCALFLPILSFTQAIVVSFCMTSILRTKYDVLFRIDTSTVFTVWM